MKDAQRRSLIGVCHDKMECCVRKRPWAEEENRNRWHFPRVISLYDADDAVSAAAAAAVAVVVIITYTIQSSLWLQGVHAKVRLRQYYLPICCHLAALPTPTVLAATYDCTFITWSGRTESVLAHDNPCNLQECHYRRKHCDSRWNHPTASCVTISWSIGLSNNRLCCRRKKHATHGWIFVGGRFY